MIKKVKKYPDIIYIRTCGDPKLPNEKATSADRVSEGLR